MVQPTTTPGKQTHIPKLKPHKKIFWTQVLPTILVIIIFGTIILAYTGVITLPRFGQSVVTLPSARVGVPYSYDFFNELAPLLGPQGDPQIYSFYLGSGVGFPPMGLVLDINGVLSGTPTAKGRSKFQVCVKDAGGRSACTTYILDVLPKEEDNQTDDHDTYTCPVTSCDTGTCCCDIVDYDPSIGTDVAVYAITVFSYCPCPNDTTYALTDNVTPGGPYSICTCNACS